MKLKRLVLQGFKSFRDKTTIHFDDGITGIVGPNGCGKSNIVDALFWVMGEQSAKHLRGKSMKDVIFAGSSKYSPASWAEVSLILENDEGKHIHIGDKLSSPSEIQLTRKLYRNSETEYRINGVPARLRDIQEVFMDTGAGAKSYSIIAQGEINRIVQAKPEERRVMIEEVAGITKFKMRRRESLRKIDQTHQNLERLKDLQSEIYKNLKSLERQAQKAEKAKSLKEKIRRLDLSVHAHRVFDSLRQFRDINTFLNESTLETEAWKLEKDNIEVGLEKERTIKTELTEDIEKEQSLFNEVSRDLAGKEERLNYLKSSLEDKSRLVESREKEGEELAQEVESRKQRYNELVELLDELQKLKSGGFDLSELEDSVDLLKNKLELKESTQRELRAELDSQKKEFYEVEQELFKFNARVETLTKSLQDITDESSELEEQSSKFSGDIAQLRDSVNKGRERSVELEDSLSSQNQELRSLEEKRSLKKEELSKVTRSILTRESRLESLKNLKEELVELDDIARDYLSENSNVALVSDLINCSEDKANIVELALSGILNSIARTNNEAINASWFNNKTTNASLLQISNSATNNYSMLEGLEPLRPHVTSEEQGLLSLLDGVYISDLTASETLVKYSSENFRAIISRNSDFIIRKEADLLKLTFTSKELAQNGAIARNVEIEKLSTEIIEFKEQENKIQSDLDGLNTELLSLKEGLDKTKEEHFKESTEYASKRATLDLQMSNLGKGNARLEILKARKSEASSERVELLDRKEKAEAEYTELKEIIKDKEEIVSEINDQLIELQVKYTEQREELLEKQMEEKTFEDRLFDTKNQLEDVERQITTAETKIDGNKKFVSDYSLEITNLDVEIKELVETNSLLAIELSEKEKLLNNKKSELQKLLSGMQARENEIRKLNSKMIKVEKEVISKEAKREQIIEDEAQTVRDMFEKHQVDLRKTISDFLEFDNNELVGLKDLSDMYQMDVLNEETDEVISKTKTAEPYEFIRKYGQELHDQKNRFKQYKMALARIGEINWQAIADYDRQKLRHDFLKSQELELKDSVEDLEKAINHIDEKSRERFKEAFEEVSYRFEKVFPIIFGGGNAKLQITGNINDPECGVDIIAQPPGKKMQNINLMSGGEKALTAVSLIFSIFLVKPSPFCLLDEVDAPLDDANVGRFNELLREMSGESQFILITHNKKTMELNDSLYGITMQEPGISTAVSVHLQ